jgi:cytochrome c-type biogenesis protein CcmF
MAVFFLGVIATGKYSDTEQIVLPKGSAVDALGYSFTYTGNAQRPDGKYEFTVRAERPGSVVDLRPVMFEAGEQGVMRNPDIASFPTRDLYVSPVSVQEEEGGHAHARSYTLGKGQPAPIGDATVTFVKFDMGAHGAGAMGSAGMRIGSQLEVVRGSEKETLIPVMVYVPNAAPDHEPAVSTLLGGTVRLTAMNAGMEAGGSAVTIDIDDGHAAGPAGESLIVEASVKPFVGLLWMGCLLMLGGFGVSIAHRSKDA